MSTRARIHASRRTQAGFTLVEVMIAVSVMASITAIMWISIATTYDTRDHLTQRHERFQMVRVTLERMTGEFASAYTAGPEHGGEPLPGESQDIQNDDALAAQAAQRTERVQFGMKGRDDEVHFTAFAHMRTQPTETASLHAEIGYFTRTRRDDDTGRLVKQLVRREDTSPDDDITRGGRVDVVLPEIEDIEIKYWDPGPVRMGDAEEVAEGRWVRDWDTTRRDQAGRLPTRVRIEITLPAMNTRSEKERFSTQARIETTEVLEF